MDAVMPVVPWPGQCTLGAEGGEVRADGRSSQTEL